MVTSLHLTSWVCISAVDIIQSLPVPSGIYLEILYYATGGAGTLIDWNRLTGNFAFMAGRSCHISKFHIMSSKIQIPKFQALNSVFQS